jgi:hypothetical protein
MKHAVGALRRLPGSSSFVLALPLIYAIHSLEESFGFPRWVAAHFSVEFTDSHFRHNVLLFLAVSALVSLTTYTFPRRITIFLFLTWSSGLLLHNALFHLGATLYFRDFSPGLASSIILYMPFTLLFSRAVLPEELLGKRRVVAALGLGGIGHYLFVGGELSAWTFG